VDPKTTLIDRSWDCFSLAVVFYELLFGIHPYAASFTNSYSTVHTTEAAISSGLFVHGRNKHEVLKLPLAHETLTRLPQPIRQLFLDTFDRGHSAPELRPHADRWGQVLYEEITKGIVAIPVPTPQPHQTSSANGTARQPAPASTVRQAPASQPASQGGSDKSGMVAIAIIVAFLLFITAMIIFAAPHPGAVSPLDVVPVARALLQSATTASVLLEKVCVLGA
jgi:hypothetical protein